MKALLGIIIATTLLGASVLEIQAGERSNRHMSSNGEFSFQVESYGSPLPIYNYRGKSYVEGTYGNSYTIRVYNHTGQRVEAVVTVDGRDVISGQVGNYRNNRGYVIDPYSSVAIEGFRNSYSSVASFVFTDVGDSYAARMGDASNVGVVGVALFKEKVYRPAPAPAYRQHEKRSTNKDQGLGTGYGRTAPSNSARAPKSGTWGGSYEMDDAAQGLGTGYGDDTYSPSTSTTFYRSGSRPNVVLSTRYDDRQGLYNRGVLPYPQPRPYRYNPPPVRPEPFPETPAFAPPPPPRWWE